MIISASIRSLKVHAKSMKHNIKYLPASSAELSPQNLQDKLRDLSNQHSEQVIY